MDPIQPWSERTESRLIEMFRQEHTLEEMARELSLPIDVIERQLTQLRLTSEPYDEEGPRLY